MYAYLEGKFTKKTPTVVYLDVNGLGYEVNITVNSYTHLQNLEQGRLYTHLQVKEDSHTLWGFFELEEKEMFLMLINISGVGAATARMMLSSLKPTDIRTAILQNNTRLIESVKGIGKKTAERLVLELKDKMGKNLASTEINISVTHSVEADAADALIALGIGRPVAESAVKKAAASAKTDNLEELLKLALKNI